MKGYREHEEYRFSYMTTKDLWRRLYKIKDREKLLWFGRVASQKASELFVVGSPLRLPDILLADEYNRLSDAALKLYNQELTTFLDPKLFEWEG